MAETPIPINHCFTTPITANKEIITRSIYSSDRTQAVPRLSVATDNLLLTLSQNIYSYSNKHNVPYTYTVIEQCNIL